VRLLDRDKPTSSTRSVLSGPSQNRTLPISKCLAICRRNGGRARWNHDSHCRATATLARGYHRFATSAGSSAFRSLLDHLERRIGEERAVERRGCSSFNRTPIWPTFEPAALKLRLTASGLQTRLDAWLR
jgi:hypothetical protein